MIQHLKRPAHQFKKAIGLIVLADLFCAFQAVFVKFASPYFSVNALVFIRCLLNLLFLYGWVVCSGGLKQFASLYQTKTWKYHLLRSAAGIGAVYCLYYSLTLMPLAPATLLFFTFPIFVPIVTRIWLRIAIIHRLWWGLGLSFLGILFVIKPSSGLLDFAAFIPLLGAILGSIATVSIRVLHRYEEKPQTIMAYYFTLGIVVSSVVLLFTFSESATEFTSSSLIFALLVGIAAALFQTLFTLSSKYAPARFLSPFIYGIFIFSALADYFVWKEPLHLRTIVGFLLILMGTIVMIFLYPKEDLTFVKKRK